MAARVISLAARLAWQAGRTPDLAIALIEIRHASLPDPILLSSDPTVRLSYEPLTFGTRHMGWTYLWVLPSIVFPDDEEGEAPKARLAIENASNHIVTLLRSIGDPLDVTMKLVMASTPDRIEFQFKGLQATRAPFDAGQVSLEFSKSPFLQTGFPYHTMTKLRFPGLHLG